jgi:hypothetical protein
MKRLLCLLLCLIGIHDWYPIKFHNKSTIINNRCSRCGSFKDLR